MQFSIAIPVYKQANFLPSALESLWVQNCIIQLAVMDATPDDSVQQVLDNYSGLFSYRRHGPDAGQAEAIQEGWKNTDGEIVAWLCADDYYFPNALKIVEKIFVDNPTIDVVYGNSVFVDERDQFLGYFPALDRDISVITKKCSICQPSCFVRRTALEAIGGLNVDLHYIMDWDLWTRLYKSGAQFYYLDEYLSVVRMYKGTKTASRSWRRFYEIARHLYRNTDIFSATKSFIHFYCYDFISLRFLGLESVIAKLLQIYHKRIKAHSSKVTHCLNYGFANQANKIDSQVSISLPWYKHSPPLMVKLSCAENAPPIIQLNGLTLMASYNTQFYYSIPEIDLASHLLHLQIASSNGDPWILYSVEIV